MFDSDDYINNNSGKAISGLIDALRDAPLDSQPIDREISEDGAEIILTNGDE